MVLKIFGLKVCVGFNEGFRVSFTLGDAYAIVNIGNIGYVYAENKSGKWHEAWRLWKPIRKHPRATKVTMPVEEPIQETRES